MSAFFQEFQCRIIILHIWCLKSGVESSSSETFEKYENFSELRRVFCDSRGLDVIGILLGIALPTCRPPPPPLSSYQPGKGKHFFTSQEWDITIFLPGMHLKRLDIPSDRPYNPLKLSIDNT